MSLTRGACHELSNQFPEERIDQLKKSRKFWKWLALFQMLLLAMLIAAGVTILGLMAVRARQAETAAREEAFRAREAADQVLRQAEEAARQVETERRAREKDRK
jgi:uncharacterized protein YpmS